MDRDSHVSSQSTSLLISLSANYTGLASLRFTDNNKFSNLTYDPLYKFPVLSSSESSRFLSRSAFTCAESVDLKRSLAVLHDKSPFRQEEEDSEQSLESCKQELSLRTREILEKLQFNFDMNGDESHYTIQSKLSLDYEEPPAEEKTVLSSEEACLSSSVDGEDAMAELLPETEESLSLFKSAEALQLAPVDDEESPALTISNRQFLRGSSASKAKLINSRHTPLCPPQLNSPLLRKVVICSEAAKAQLVESRESTQEVRNAHILYSFAASGFSTAPVVEYSSKDSDSCGTIPYENTEHIMVILMPPTILKELIAYTVEWVSCGYEHMAAVTNQGKVLSWGYGASGCLGHGDRNSYFRPSFVVGILDQDVVYLECGGYHTVALSASGTVWTWGRGDVHQLGLPFESLENDGTGHVSLLPQKISLQGIKNVACGEAHTLALDSNGKIFAFGWAEEGQLGLSEECISNQLCSIDIFQVRLPHKVVKVAAGAAFSTCITESGSVFVWGSGEQGQLGLGGNLRKCQFPALLSAIANETVIEIACGESHAFAFTAQGHVYAWGKGIVGDFEDPEDYPFGSEIVCFVPRQLKHIDIVHRFITREDFEI